MVPECLQPELGHPALGHGLVSSSLMRRTLRPVKYAAHPVLYHALFLTMMRRIQIRS